MSENEEKETTRRRPRNTDDAGQKEVQENMDEINEKGYLGEVPDPTPNENYTVEGVTQGKPTPETDSELANEVRRSVFR